MTRSFRDDTKQNWESYLVDNNGTVENLTFHYLIIFFIRPKFNDVNLNIFQILAKLTSILLCREEEAQNSMWIGPRIASQERRFFLLKTSKVMVP